MYTVENHVGHLVETRVQQIETDEELQRFIGAHRAMGERLGQFVICADYRPVTIFPPSVAEGLQRLMSALNPAVRRSAILVAPHHATNYLQVERIVRAAGHSERRSFRARAELSAFLAPALSPDERARLEVFLDGWPPR